MRWLLFSLAIVALPGCRNNARLDAHLELMNAERRALEDELYELEFDHEAALEELEESRQQIERLKQQLAGSPLDELDAPDRDELPDGVPDVDLTPPTVEPGIPTSPPEPEGGPESVLRKQPVRQPVSIRKRFVADDPGDRPITHIFLDPERTGSADLDGRPGSDGIAVVIQPRDDTGQFVPRAGDVSVVLLDYAKRDSGDEARVARWDLDAEQTGKLLYDSQSRRGIYLELPWPRTPPERRRLRMHVRFTTADGRQLETRQDIQLRDDTARTSSTNAPEPESGKLSRQLSKRGWTPRSVRRSTDAAEPSPPRPDTESGPPWSLERVAGDAIHQQGGPQSGEQPSEQQASRPNWRPYR